MRIFYEDMKREFERVLLKKGFSQERAETSAKMFADTSLDGVYSHGYQRFPRVIEYIDKGYIHVMRYRKSLRESARQNAGTDISEWEI